MSVWGVVAACVTAAVTATTAGVQADQAAKAQGAQVMGAANAQYQAQQEEQVAANIAQLEDGDSAGNDVMQQALQQFMPNNQTA